MASDKPSHLAPKYAATFQSPAVAEAYSNRPPYPAELFDILISCIADWPARLLELGCGTGDLSLRLAPLVDRLDAIDPSRAMLAAARRRPKADHPNLRWIESSAEEFDYSGGPYAMVVSAEAFHWLDWSVVIPKAAQALTPNGLLAIVDGRSGWLRVPWADDLRALIQRYSTRPRVEINLIDELERRGLVKATQRLVTKPLAFAQSIENYCRALHSSSGLSVDTLGPAKAKAFDAELERIVRPYATSGSITRDIVARVTLGRPLSQTPI